MQPKKIQFNKGHAATAQRLSLATTAKNLAKLLSATLVTRMKFNRLLWLTCLTDPRGVACASSLHTTA
jgi:hypothetical protein